MIVIVHHEKELLECLCENIENESPFVFSHFDDLMNLPNSFLNKVKLLIFSGHYIEEEGWGFFQKIKARGLPVMDISFLLIGNKVQDLEPSIRKELNITYLEMPFRRNDFLLRVDLIKKGEGRYQFLTLDQGEEVFLPKSEIVYFIKGEIRLDRVGFRRDSKSYSEFIDVSGFKNLEIREKSEFLLLKSSKENKAIEVRR